MSNSGFYTFGQVEREFGIGKATLSRDRSKGKLSAEKQEDGSYRVSGAELARVYGDRLRPRDAETVDGNGAAERPATPDEAAETEVLRVQLEAAERLARERADTIADLRARLDAADEERRGLTRILTDQREKPAPETARRGFRWPWSSGRSAG